MPTTSTNGGGQVTSEFGGSIYSITVQADGKILAAGSDKLGDFALARYNANGSLDTTFGSNGKATTDFSLSISDIGYTGAISNDCTKPLTR